jgi:STE24 endopeptidase
MAQIIFYGIVTIFVLDFILEFILERLNAQWRTKPIPELLSDIYNHSQYQKQQQYASESDRFGLWVSFFTFGITLAFLLANGFGWLHYLLEPYFEQPALLGLVYFATLFGVLDILTMPFNWYSTFVIEQKYGFNTTTVKTYITDKLKGYALAIIIGGALYLLIYWIYVHTGNLFWLLCWALMAAFAVFMALFYSNLIVPLFNKQTPLPQGDLRTAIEEFGARAGFNISNIFVIDGSKRSTRANAYFTGFGPKKRIVLYDTLINDLTTDEVVAVLAHEIGHYKHKHTIVSMILGLVQMGVMFYLLSLFLNNSTFSMALGVSNPQFHISIIVFSMLYSPVSELTGIAMNLYSRKNEYQADAFAARYGLAQPLVAGLKKLATKNLSNLTPHPWYVFVSYSHPPLYERIKALNGNITADNVYPEAR